MCDMTRSQVFRLQHVTFEWVVAFTVTCPIFYVRHDSSICPHLQHVTREWVVAIKRDMTHSYVWHDSFTSPPFATCHMSMSCGIQMWHGPFICVTWLIHMSRPPSVTCHIRMSCSIRVWRDPCIRVTWLIHMSPICNMSHMNESWHPRDTHSHVWHDPWKCPMCIVENNRTAQRSKKKKWRHTPSLWCLACLLRQIFLICVLTYQKSPVHIVKETYIYDKRDLSIQSVFSLCLECTL